MKKNKIIIGSSIALTSLILSGFAFASTHKFNSLKTYADDFSITLNSNNSYASGNSQNITTDSGASTVKFLYVSCSSSNNNHALINSGGTIENTEQITSISRFNVVYTGGSIKAQLSYDGLNWSSFFEAESGLDYDLESNPYYIRIKATGDVYLNSWQIHYSCLENQEVNFTETTKYILIKDNVKAGDKVVVASQSNWNSTSCYVLTDTVLNTYYFTPISGTVANQELNKTSAMTEWTVGGTTGAYTFSSSNGYLRGYMNGTYRNLGLAQNTSVTGVTWDINLNASITGYDMVSSDGVYLEYYSTKNSYSGYSASATDYVINFYKKTIIYEADIVPSEDYYDNVDYSWVLVNDVNDLNNGDLIVFANIETEHTAGTLNTNNHYLQSVLSSFSDSGEEITELNEETIIFTLGISSGYFTFANENDELFGATAAKNVTFGSGTTNWDIDIDDSGNAVISSATSTYGTLQYNSSSPRFTTYTSDQSDVQIFKAEIIEPIYATDFSLSGDNELGIGRTMTLTTSFVPANTNQKTISWSSSNEDIATVNNQGLIRGISTGNAVITADLLIANNNHLVRNFALTINDVPLDAYTIMIYISGNDLESDTSYGGAATADIAEILQTNVPDGVNILIQTGGASRWESTYGIDATKTQRYHVSNHSLVLESSVARINMGLSSTFQSFIEWGLNEYPATQTGVILWNHGGAMSGCCFDENFENDPLAPDELCEGMANAFASTGHSEKLTWIGYDCCLMSVADIASINADYFDYMVASEESEYGYGWDYTGWLPKIANNPAIDPETLLPYVCDSFVDFYNPWGTASNNQTLAVLDLTTMDDFVLAFNNYVTALNINSSTKYSYLISAFESSQRFGYEEDYETYFYGVADFASFLSNVKTQFPSVDQTSIKNALNELIIYDKYGGYYSANGTDLPCGTCVFLPTAGDYYWGFKSEYNANCTKFTVLREVVMTYGDAWLDSYYGY